MAQLTDLPKSLAVFPLPGAILLPRARLPLHLFEPRYLAMLDDALKTHERLIGMIQPYEGPNGAANLHKIGCAGRITAMSETDDGRYMITLSGISRFRLKDEINGFTPYRKFYVAWDEFDADRGPEQDDPKLDHSAFFKLLKRYFDDSGLKTDWGSLEKAKPELLINTLSTLCPFAPEEKQALLEAPTLSTRRETLVTLIEYALRGGEGGATLQ